MTRSKWKGLDLVRKETDGSPKPAQPARRGASLLRNDAPPTPTPKPTPKRDPLSSLGRIRTRRVIKGPDGQVYDLTQNVPVWLVQIDDINAIFLSDALKGRNYQVQECPRLDGLLQRLNEAEEAPKLVVFEARTVGQQTPFFRKSILPILQQDNIESLMTGVLNEAQENSFRQWYDGHMLVGGDIDEFLDKVVELIGEVPD